MPKVSEVERIHDGPFLHGLQIDVEKAQNLLFDLHIVKIKYDFYPSWTRTSCSLQ